MVPVVPPRRKRRSFFGRLLVWLLLVGAGYVTFRFYGAAIWRYATRMVPALRRMEKEKPAPTPRPAPVPSATTSATVSAATPVPSAAAATDVQACVAPLFPANTFVSGQSDLSFVCSETEPANGAKSLRNQVVVGAGKDATSEAMKEWSTLGWYGMAVFAIARARCCKDAPPLSTPTVLKDCALDESLTRLGAATFETSNDASEKALYAYRGAVKCIVKNGAAQAFGQQGEPRGGELTTFKKTYERARRLIAQK